MKIIEAEERNTVKILASEFLHESGALRIRPELIGKGYIEIRQTKDELSLSVHGLIGRLPINDSITLDIHPKFPINNLNRMIYASETQLSSPFYIGRSYELMRTQDYLPIPLIRTFTKELARTIEQGVFRTYIRQELNASPRPKINFGKSSQKHWSRLQPTKAVIEEFNYSSDCLPNQCLKLAIRKSLALSRATNQLNECTPILIKYLRQLERVSTKQPNEVIRELENAANSIPSFRADYVKTLNYAVELIRHSDVNLNIGREELSLESYVISLDDVFESYIRNTIARISTDNGMSISTVDGNKKAHRRPLFIDNKTYPTKPDLIVKNHTGVLMLGDAKYKREQKESDRYQIIAHALAYGVDKVFLIYPKKSTDPHHLRKLGRIGTGPNQITVFEYFFDLDGNLYEEEDALRSMIRTLTRPSLQ